MHNFRSKESFKLLLAIKVKNTRQEITKHSGNKYSFTF